MPLPASAVAPARIHAQLGIAHAAPRPLSWRAAPPPVGMRGPVIVIVSHRATCRKAMHEPGGASSLMPVGMCAAQEDRYAMRTPYFVWLGERSPVEKHVTLAWPLTSLSPALYLLHLGLHPALYQGACALPWTCCACTLPSTCCVCTLPLTSLK